VRWFFTGCSTGASRGMSFQASARTGTIGRRGRSRVPPMWSLVKIIPTFPVVLAASAAVCLAQPVPTFSTHEHCKRLASSSVPYSEPIYLTCMNVKYDARAALESSWPSFPGSARRQCIPQATVGGLGSYTMLRTCLLSTPIPEKTQTPSRPLKFYLRSPADLEGTPFATMQECLAAREKLGHRRHPASEDDSPSE
jgi:hypothetical protein